MEFLREKEICIIILRVFRAFRIFNIFHECINMRGMFIPFEQDLQLAFNK